MTKQLSLLLLLFFALSCGKGGGQNESINSLYPSSSDDYIDAISVDDPVPTQAETFGFNITYVNFTSEQQEKYEKALEVVSKVLASDEFKRNVLGHTYGGFQTFVDNANKSNSAIYQHILDGNETLQSAKNNQMDVEVELYFADTTTIGYTYANSRRIWVNTKYFNVYTPASVAGNLFHEWLHKLGYSHSSTYSVSRDYSVPYAIGRMISSLGKKYE